MMRLISPAAISLASPTFSTHSGSHRRLELIAARVITEMAAAEPQTSDDALFADYSTQEYSSAEKGEGTEVGDSDDFEFSFLCREPEAEPITADVCFSNGQIRPLFPIFDSDLVFHHPDGVEASPARGSKVMPRAAVRLPTQKLMTGEKSGILEGSISSGRQDKSKPAVVKVNRRQAKPATTSELERYIRERAMWKGDQRRSYLPYSASSLVGRQLSTASVLSQSIVSGRAQSVGLGLCGATSLPDDFVKWASLGFCRGSRFATGFQPRQYKPLDTIMDVERVKDRSVEDIISVWNDMPHMFFTGLEDYKARGTQAAPYFTVTYYPEFRESKDLELIRGDVVFTSKLSEEAKWHLETAQFYLNDTRYNLVEQFNKHTHDFEFKNVLQALGIPLM